MRGLVYVEYMLFVSMIVVEAVALQNHVFQPGDLVIYTLSKQSAHPGPRARSVHPAELGDDYSYIVDKFWMVAGIDAPDQVRLVTRKGKLRTVSASDPLLWKANWWQRFRYRTRFPDPEVLQHNESVGVPG